MDALTEYNDEEAREGYLRLTNGGSYIYADPDGKERVPNPFGLTRGTYLELSKDTDAAFKRFIESRNDEDLRGA